METQFSGTGTLIQRGANADHSFLATVDYFAHIERPINTNHSAFGTVRVQGDPRFGLRNMGREFTLIMEDGFGRIDIVISGPNGEFAPGPRGYYQD